MRKGRRDDKLLQAIIILKCGRENLGSNFIHHLRSEIIFGNSKPFKNEEK